MPDNVAVGTGIVGVTTVVGATEPTDATGSFPPQPAKNVGSQTTNETKANTRRIASPECMAKTVGTASELVEDFGIHHTAAAQIRQRATR